MGAWIEYKEGDILGEYGNIFIQDIPNTKPRKAIFKCGFCGKKFTCRISSIKNGHTKSCGCKWQKYNPGDLIGPKKILLKEREIPARGTFICPLCGNSFKSYISHIANGLIQSCGCKKISVGEEKIEKILISLNIKYEKQKTFSECKNFYSLPFDFYLPDYNCCIEYDGVQHFEALGGWNTEEALQGIRYRDNIKNQYCKNNSIKLIRIPYYNYNLLNKEYLYDRIK